MTILTSDQIEKYIHDYDLISDPKDEAIPSGNIQPASYDFRLGSEYIKNGKEGNLLNDTAHTLYLEPYDFVVVGSHEIFKLPPGIAARFQTKMSLAFNGVNMTMGAQVDPGYSGKLYCTLFNCTKEPIAIRHLDHLATIEFRKTTDYIDGTTKLYDGEYMNLKKIKKLFQAGKYPDSGLKEYYSEIKGMYKRLNKLESDRFLISLPSNTKILIILTILIIIVMILIGISALYPTESKNFLSNVSFSF